MLAVLLFGFTGILVCKELHGTHRLDEVVDMVLREVSSKQLKDT